MLLERLHSTLVEGLFELRHVETVTHTPQRKDAITLPAIMLDMVELEPGKDSGTGELTLLSHWEARVVTLEKDSLFIHLNIVQNLMLWLFNFAWPNINVGRPKLKQVAPDHFNPELQGHRVWLIEWAQEIRVGENIWLGNNITPTRITVSYGENNSEEILS